MPEIDLNLVGQKTEPFVYEYTWKDVVLYALGIGAQADELSFIYENAPGDLKVIPSFCVIPEMINMVAWEKLMDLTKMLHGEQIIRLHRPIPPEGKLVIVGEVDNIFDKGKAALIHCKTTGTTEDGELVFDSVKVGFYRDAGGFGGDPGPKAEPLTPPEGVNPDFSVSYKIPLTQGALYRLNGDLNPLHVDPAFAKKGGFETPILHGLCTYGYAARAIVNSICEGDVGRFKEFRARFSDVVYPGETLTTEGWKDDKGRYITQVRTERAVVINSSYCKVE